MFRETRLLFIVITIFHSILSINGDHGSCHLGGRTVCIPSDQYGSCNFSQEGTRFDVTPRVGNQDGIYDLSLTILDGGCLYDLYTVAVHLMNDDDDDDDDEQLMHTYYIPSKIRKCSQIRIEFCLKYWFSGYYYFLFTPRNGTNSYKTMEYKYRLKNNYSAKNFTIQAPSILTANTESHLKVEWKFDKSLNLNDDDVHYEVMIKDAVGNKRAMSVTQNCTQYGPNYECIINNLSSGFYKTSFDLIDNWRCDNHNIYGTCSWNSTIERHVSPNVSSLRSLAPLHATNWTVVWVSFMVIFSVCITSLVGWFFIKKNKSKKESQQTYDNELCEGKECHIRQDEKVTGIYLVYAKDCNPFMSVMTNFRDLLKKMTKCKVYDVFDDALFNVIAENPNEWVQSRIQDPNIKVVLVATDCAEHLYQGLMKHHSNSSQNENRLCHIDMYQFPSYFDGIILYSLKLISFDVSPAPYHKFFVVRFPKFNKEDDYLCHINPFKRFDMPDNLEALAENILHQTEASDIDWDDTEECYGIRYEKPVVTKETFNKAVDELNDFFKENSDYLMDEVLKDEKNVDPFQYDWLKHSRSRHDTL